MLDVKSVGEVFNILDENFSGFSLESEIIELKDALNRILSEDITAHEDIPGFDRSLVDGYAVISSDTFGASDAIPAQLQLAGEVKMGEKPSFLLEKGQTAYVPTGGEVPQNADSVVMIEYTEDFNDGYIFINKPSAPGNSMVYKGDDIRTGSTVMKAGRVLRPHDAGALAAMGYARVPVKRKVRVGIISTGDEVVGIDKIPSGAQVRDVNSYFIYTGLVEFGAQPLMYGIVKDNYENIKKAVERALSECDIVLISGGSSVGFKDLTYRVIESLGAPGTLVHGIAVKPGKPTIIGRIGSKAVIGLPGHPASAYFVFRIFIYKLLDIITGIKCRYSKTIRAEMVCNYPSNNGREEFVAVWLEEREGLMFAHPVFSKSGLIALLTTADGYIHIDRGSEGIPSGREAEVVLF